MRIGVLATSLQGHDGWSDYARHVALALIAEGQEVVALTQDITPEVTVPQVACLPKIAPLGRKQVLRLRGARQKAHQALLGCDVVHVLAEPYALLGAWLAGNRPFFITGHGTYVNLPRMTRLIPFHWGYRWAFAKSSLICVSHYTASVAKAVMPALKTHVITNGIDANERPYTLSSSKTSRIILTSGGIKPRKGTLELVNALASVRDVLPDVQCYIVGNAPDNAYTGRVKDAIATHHLQENVHLTGFISQEALRQHYAEADVFVMPSINEGFNFEGFGLVHLQAGLAGLPTIGTKGCGAEDAIIDGQTGMLLSQDTLRDTLAPAILRLLQHPDEAQHLGQNGRAYALTQSWERVAQAMISVYSRR